MNFLYLLHAQLRVSKMDGPRDSEDCHVLFFPSFKFNGTYNFTLFQVRSDSVEVAISHLDLRVLGTLPPGGI